MFVEGDVIGMYEPQAQKHKFLLCVAEGTDEVACKFIYINSNKGYEGDFVVADDELPCLPESETGESVFSLTIVLRYNNAQLVLFKASRKGELGLDLAQKLLEASKTVATLSGRDRRIIVTGLETYLNKMPAI